MLIRECEAVKSTIHESENWSVWFQDQSFEDKQALIKLHTSKNQCPNSLHSPRLLRSISWTAIILPAPSIYLPLPARQSLTKGISLCWNSINSGTGKLRGEANFTFHDCMDNPEFPYVRGQSAVSLNMCADICFKYLYVFKTYRKLCLWKSSWHYFLLHTMSRQMNQHMHCKVNKILRILPLRTSAMINIDEK